MIPLQPIFKKAYYSLVIFGAIYVLGVYIATYPAVNRSLLYMNWLNPTYFQDVNDVERFGFLPHQVQPFTLTTPDNETLYAWHILPAHVAHEHAALLKEKRTFGPAADYTQTGAFQLLRDDPNARVIVNLHGNAVHLASGYRPATYTSFLAASTRQAPVHIIAFDYRGFGLSSGTPTEEDLITDAETVIRYVNEEIGVGRKKIAVVGHSLGTAVAAGVVERMSIGEAQKEGSKKDTERKEMEPFAGVILFSGFADLSSLVKTYSLFGIFPPFLSPLVQYPSAQKYVLRHLADKWETAQRLARLTGVAAVAAESASDADAVQNHIQSQSATAPPFLELSIIHAKDDREIWWGNGFKIFTTATNTREKRGKLAHADEKVAAAQGGDVVFDEESMDKKGRHIIWEKKRGDGNGNGKTRVRWERVRYGDHNRITATQVATVAIVRLFEGDGSGIDVQQ